MRYIVVSHVRELARLHGRRVGRDFLHVLSAEVERLVKRAAEERDGGRITLKRDVLHFVMNRKDLIGRKTA